MSLKISSHLLSRTACWSLPIRLPSLNYHSGLLDFIKDDQASYFAYQKEMHGLLHAKYFEVSDTEIICLEAIAH